MNRRELLALAIGAAGASAALAGCGPAGAPGQQTVSFEAAETATVPVTIEGIPEVATIRQSTGKPTEFTLREESSARTLRVVAAPGVAVPANITSASYVVVTGTYDRGERTFRATQVETRVPNRDQQPRG